MPDKNHLTEAADAVKKKLPSDHGFILLAVPMNTLDPRVNYISNVQRKDAITMLKTFLFTAGDEEEWMKHIK